MHRTCAIVFWSAVLALPLSGMAGGGPQNVLVVVNQASENSMALGNYYRETRGIPPFNVFAVNVDVTNNMDTVTFSNQVRNPIVAYIADAGLSNQIDYIVFMRDIPYRVYHGIYTNMRFSSITSAMFYDFKSSPDAFVEGCDLASGSAHSYFAAERAFRRAVEGDHFYYPSTYMTSWTPDQTRDMIDRAGGVDFSQPTGHVYLVHSIDILRNIRWTQYEEAQFIMRFIDTPLDTFFAESPPSSAVTNTMGYATGARTVSGISAFDLQPGSLAEHLTSYGGNLFDSNQGKGDPNQMSILHWIGNGAAGSYGTLVEPCANTNKFPQARLHAWYARGFNLAEAFYMSVRNPYQGIVVGDPLTQPYAQPPVASINGINPLDTVSGIVTVTVVGAFAHAEQQVDQLDLFQNDRLITSLTNVAPTAGNVISAVINGTTRSYTIGANDTIYDAAQGLAASINAIVPPPPIPYTAIAHGDRVEIVQDALGEPGAALSFDALSAMGSGSELTIRAHPVSTQFIESTASALRAVRIMGTPTAGDVVRATITRLDNVIVTNEITATSGSTARTMMTNLMETINSDTNLQDSQGVRMALYAQNPNTSSQAEAVFISRTNSWQSYAPHLDFEVISSSLEDTSASGLLNDNAHVLSARATLFLSAGRTNLSASYVLDTTALPDGPHTLRAVAYDGSGTRTQGHALLPFSVNNHSGTCAIVFPEHGANIAGGNVVTVLVDVALSPGTVTAVQFHAHGQLIAQNDTAPWTFAWDTAEQGAGLIDLQAKSFGDGGEEVSSAVNTVRVFMDSDGDGIPDWWEYVHFGGSTNAVADADNDGDGTTNLEEYIADTDPNDDQDFFAITQLEQGNDGDLESFVFASSTARVYRVHYLDEQLTNYPAWTPAHAVSFAGAAPDTTWDTTNAPPATNAMRFFRVEVSVP